jgi:pullulanase
LPGGFLTFRSYWIDRLTIALPPGDVQRDQHYRLVHSDGVIPLSLAEGLNIAQHEKYPQLRSFAVFHLPGDTGIPQLASALKGGLQVESADKAYLTGVQTAGVLDDLFRFNGKLGAQFPDDPRENISVRVWAPTARAVKLLLYNAQTDTSPAHTVPMMEANGVWSAEVENTWRNRYYLFAVTVYVPGLGREVENIVTDPYSCDLALNGSKSRFTDLNDPRSKPEGWDGHRSPQIGSNNHLSIWEAHVREFSASDESIPAEQRGTYLAFANPDSTGMKHLRRLAEAGLKAVHLMPTFHIASINEDKTEWQSPGDLSAYAPDSSEQQAAVATVQYFDGYNWGYDPVHYAAPEGSYAMNPDERVKEYRAMVQGLHSAGLRVIQDLVFNHTDAHGQDPNSILDKIVPTYYHRWDGDGNVLNSSCCSNTASEHYMLEKLMIDTIVQNARHYKIDGFRFDLMGLHFVYNMRHIQEALNDPEIYLYGEGWNLGETSNNALGLNASQLNLYGSGIGTFNDRVRDAVRGGNPFDDPREQGFATGLYTDENSDLIRAALAGNMRDFQFLNSRGESITAGGLTYAGQPAGYTASPVECINYCSVHDNQALFDAIQIKAPADEDISTRARRQVLALSLIALGQGIPFFYGGDELLRSKNMDNNSYNSGDWFNRLDFTYQTNNWGTGLPLASENQSHWALMQPLLANQALKPASGHILHTRDAFESLLRIRASSALFHMQTIEEVQRNLTFLQTRSGVIAMRLNASGGKYTGYQQILAIFNATTQMASVSDALLKGLALKRHPVMREGVFDSASGTADIPALACAVFVNQ